MTNAAQNSIITKKGKWLVLGLILLALTNCNGADYYWVGGSGNWSDVSHWATTSGGAVFYSFPPTSNDDVYFDNNSFVSNTDTVYSSGGYDRCNTFNLNSTFTPYLTTPTVNSNVNLQSLVSNPVLWIHFSGTGTNNTILSGGNLLSLQFDSIGTWHLLDDFTGNINLLNGTLYTHGHAVNITGNILWVDYYGSIYFGTSTVTMNNPGSSLFSQPPADIYGDSASFNVNGMFSHYSGIYNHRFKSINAQTLSLAYDTVETVIFNDSLFYISGDHIKNVVVNGTGTLPKIISDYNNGSDDSYFGKCTINGSGCFFKTDSFFGNPNATIHFDTLFIANPNCEIVVSDGDTLYINDALLANYSAGNTISIHSVTPGQPCYISKAIGIVCLDYLNLKDVHAIGGALFSAGTNSTDNGNNTGWQFTSCAAAISNCNVLPGWNVWTGAASNDWYDPQNWCNGVPVTTTNVAIINDVDTLPGIQPPLYQPILTGPVSINKLKIEGPDSLSVDAPFGPILIISDSLFINDSNSVFKIVNDSSGRAAFGVGTNIDTTSNLFGSANTYSKENMQIVYSQSQLLAEGLRVADKIDTLVISIDQRNSTIPYSNFSISYYYTTVGFSFNGASPTLAPIVVAGATVFNGTIDLSSPGPFYIPPSGGLLKIPLSTPIIWSASSNSLVINFCWDNGALTTASDNNFSVQDTALNQVLRIRATPSYTGAACLIAPGSANTVTNIADFRPITFIYHSTYNLAIVRLAGHWVNNGTFIRGNSKVSFLGSSQQTISGNTSTLFHDLEVNNSSGVLQNTSVTVDNIMSLVNGKFILNGKTITINNQNTAAINFAIGRFLSEDLPPNYGLVNWKIGNNPAIHTIPFVNANNNFIPFDFTLTSGTSDLTVGTYHTPANNTPLPTGVTHINNASGLDNSANMVDRYWIVNDNGVNPVADIKFNYGPTEGTGVTQVISQRWDGSNWKSALTGQSNPTSTSNLTPSINQFNSVWALSNVGSTLATNDYYWVGGTGNWSDISHWATTSGGTTFNTTPPDSSNDVYFDANSFTGLNDTVYVNGNGNCNSFNYSAAVGNFSSISDSLFVKGSLNITGTGNFSYPDLTFSFRGAAQGNGITSNSNMLNLFFHDSTSGSWAFNDDFEGDLRINNGNIDFGNNNFHFLNNVALENGFVDLDQSTIHCDHGFSISFAVVSGDQASITCDSGNFVHMNPLTPAKFKYLESYSFLIAHDSIEQIIVNHSFVATSNLTINSLTFEYGAMSMLIADPATTNKFNKLIFKSYATPVFDFNGGRQVIDSLLFIPPLGDALAIKGGDTLVVNNYLFFNNPFSLNFLGAIQVPPIGNLIYNGAPICLKNTNIENINVTGAITADTSCINAGGNTGITFAPCNNFSDVWPGDANYDLIANNNDVLNIGLTYGNTGPVRLGASNNWTAQPAGDWNYFFQNLANHKHADCDGNGLVDNADTAAISLNYGLTHPARMASGNSLTSLTDPTFYLEVSPDSASLSDTVDVNIYLGTSAIPVDSIYGIAFTVDIDTSYVDTTYMTFDYTGTWMGIPGVDLMTYQHTRFSQSAVDFAFTRIDQNNIGGFGYLGKIGVVIVDNVDARVSVPFVLNNVFAITASEYELALQTQTGWVSIDTTTTGIGNNDINRRILVFPNPAKNKVIVISRESSISGFELTDEFGRIVHKTISQTGQKSFAIPSPGKGFYILRLFTDHGIVIRKIIFLE